MDQTPFSSEFQRLASKSGRKYKQIAIDMGVSPALLTRVISGDRPPTQNFVEKTVRVFNLNGKCAERLRHFAEISQDKIIIEPRDIKEAEKVVAFKKSLRTDSEQGQQDECTEFS